MKPCKSYEVKREQYWCENHFNLLHVVWFLLASLSWVCLSSWTGSGMVSSYPLQVASHCIRFLNTTSGLHVHTNEVPCLFPPPEQLPYHLQWDGMRYRVQHSTQWKTYETLQRTMNGYSSSCLTSCVQCSASTFHRNLSASNLHATSPECVLLTSRISQGISPVLNHLAILSVASLRWHLRHLLSYRSVRWFRFVSRPVFKLHPVFLVLHGYIASASRIGCHS